MASAVDDDAPTRDAPPAVIFRLGHVAALVAVAASTALTACSLLLSSDEYAGGEANTDAGTVVDGDAATLDASDASMLDADALPAPPFCVSRDPRPTFCADFDLASSPEDGWTFVSRNGPSTIFELDSTAFVSPSKSLRAGIPAGVPGTGSGFTSRVVFESPRAPTSVIHVEAKLRIDAVDPLAQPYLLWLTWGDSASLLLRASRTDASLFEQIVTDGAFESTPMQLSKLIAYQTWTKVVIDVSFGASTTAEVRVDGVLALTTPPLDSAITKAIAPKFAIGPGHYTNAQVQATEVHFDDVVLDVR